MEELNKEEIEIKKEEDRIKKEKVNILGSEKDIMNSTKIMLNKKSEIHEKYNIEKLKMEYYIESERIKEDYRQKVKELDEKWQMEINKLTENNNEYKKLKKAKEEENKRRIEEFENAKEKLKKETALFEKTIQNYPFYLQPYVVTKDLHVGLKNLGLTCYMNSILQNLMRCVGMSSDFLTKKLRGHFDKEPQSKTISAQYVKVLYNCFVEPPNYNDNNFGANNFNFNNNNNNNFNFNNNNNFNFNNHPNNINFANNFNNPNNFNQNVQKNLFYKPVEFKREIGEFFPLFKGIKASDAKDIITIILPKMHEEMNESNGDVVPIYDFKNYSDEKAVYENFRRTFLDLNKSVISRELYVVMKNVTKCGVCGNLSFGFETQILIDIPLKAAKFFILNRRTGEAVRREIGGGGEIDVSIPAHNNLVLRCLWLEIIKNKGKLSLLDALEYFFAENFFDFSNASLCHFCGRETCGSTRRRIYSLCPSLIICLNRGKNSADFAEDVAVPAELDLAEFVENSSFSGPSRFYLGGTVNHKGESGDSGHYIAYCRFSYGERWMLYDDDKVSLGDEGDITKNGVPYLLFYRAIPEGL